MNITVSPFTVGEWHGVELTRVNEDILDWLLNRGEEGRDWFLRSNWIYFRDQRDHTMFLLRWQ